MSPSSPGSSGVQVIPVALYHQLLLDHNARTVELQRVRGVVGMEGLSRNEYLQEETNALIERSRWVKLGYQVAR